MEGRVISKDTKKAIRIQGADNTPIDISGQSQNLAYHILKISQIKFGHGFIRNVLALAQLNFE